MRARGLIAVLLAVLLAGQAHAESAVCSDADDPACQGGGAAPDDWRERIDAGRARLTDTLFGLELSVFADVASQYDEAGTQSIGFGSVELGGSVEFTRGVQAAFAFVTDSESTVNSVGFIDLNMQSGRAAPRGRLWVEKGNHLQVGRFDVPFGNDWQFFASKDSVSVSRPLTTERIMEGGYNDEGLRVFGNNGSYNFTAFGLRGFGGGRLVGARAGITPLSDPFSLSQTEDPVYLEFGLSYLYDADTSRRASERSRALDLEAHRGDWSMRAEYMQRDQTPQGGERIRGWHLTQEFILDEWDVWEAALFARYEQVWADAADSRDVRTAFGSRVKLGDSDVLLWKLEAQQYRVATPDTQSQPGYARWMWFTQLVLVL